MKKEDSIEKRQTTSLETKTPLDVVPEDIKKKLKSIHDFQIIIKEKLHEGHDFGIIPGTEKPTLLKPGAEKIAKLLNLNDDYFIMKEIEDWEKPFFHYQIKCELREVNSNLLVSAGLGSCNSRESKYRYRWVPEWKLSKEQVAMKDSVTYEERSWRRDPNRKFKVYRFENDEIFSQVNTILKMAKKRSLVDAALSAGRLSDLFTQDLEDMIGRAMEEEEEVDVTPKEVVEQKPPAAPPPPKPVTPPKPPAKPASPPPPPKPKEETPEEEEPPWPEEEEPISSGEEKKEEVKQSLPADRQSKEISKIIGTLVDKHKVDPGYLLEKIMERLLKKYPNLKKLCRIPEDLTAEQAAMVLAILRSTLTAYEQKGGKE